MFIIQATDWAIFHQLGYLCRIIEGIGPRMAIPWATNLLQFYLNELFKNMVCILALLGLTTALATFQKIG
jgi:hypothetical protein